MIVIRCLKCKRKVFKYKKIGAGKVLRCFKQRISRFYQKPQNGLIVCECGQHIATEKDAWFVMHQHNFYYTGKVIK